MEGIIRFSYKRFIDENSVFVWDKAVFENSYMDYKIQIQNFPEFEAFPVFADFLKNVPEAETIHHKVSQSIYQNLNQLDGIIPQIVDAYGGFCLQFRKFKFEIIDSDLFNKSKHRVSIEFISEPLLCLGKMGDDFLIAPFEELENYKNNQEIATRLIPSQKFLNIYSYQKMV